MGIETPLKIQTKRRKRVCMKQIRSRPKINNKVKVRWKTIDPSKLEGIITLRVKNKYLVEILSLVALGNR